MKQNYWIYGKKLCYVKKIVKNISKYKKILKDVTIKYMYAKYI